MGGKALLYFLVAVCFIFNAGTAAEQPVLTKTLNLPIKKHQGYFREHCVDLLQGQVIQYDVRVKYALDFNIHLHLQNKIEYLVTDQMQDQYSGQLQAPSGGEYCFMWTNQQDRPKSFVVELSYRVVMG